jgi:hypothetical protein
MQKRHVYSSATAENPNPLMSTVVLPDAGPCANRELSAQATGWAAALMRDSKVRSGADLAFDDACPDGVEAEGYDAAR